MKKASKIFGGLIFLYYICITKEKIKINNYFMDYMNLKQGDVIVIHWKNERIIAIFDKYMYGYNSIRICCDLHEYHREDGYLCTEAERLHSFEFGLDNITYRKASEGEKNRIYNAIGKKFVKHDENWYKHFTDSSYFDIQDYLFDIFCIDVKEYDDDLIYPDFINEIHTYIWDQLCQAMGVHNTVEDKPEMVNKQAFIEKAVKYFEANFPDIENVGGCYKESFINNFRKIMDE